MCCEGVARITGRPPAVPLTAVRMARKRMYFSPAKAVRELGLPQTDPTVALRDAVAWFAAHGYAARARTHESRQPRARSLTRKSRSNFYYAFLSLPRARRDALYAVYAFCRTVDDVADLGHDRGRRPARGALARWRHGRRALLRAGAAPRRIRSRCSWRDAVRAYPIPRAALEAIIDGCEMDLDRVRYETRRGPLSVLLPRGLGGRSLLHRDLRLHRPAGPRLRSPARHGAAADEHHPRRGADARVGRVYLPQQDLKEFGVTPRTIWSPAGTTSGSCA